MAWYSDKHCKDCGHWHKLDPPGGGAVDLSQVRGECRMNPPAVTTMILENKKIELANYPKLPPEFRACSQFQLPET